MPDIYLTNSLSRKKEKFTPINPPKVGMYTCGMTVYDYAHIGHGRKYVADDILRRVLSFNGYQVKHVQNVTDVGHLTSDADEGEDKLEKGAKKSGKNVWQVAEFFTKHFYESMDKLNILKPHVIPKATKHIKEQIALIERLFENGYAYDTPEAVYFDTLKFKDYEKMFGQALIQKKVAVRKKVKKGKHKKNPTDFSLWFKRVGKFAKHEMHWDSPWGDGFPGWHIECSAMSMKYLGDQFDIHTGGEDHLPIHHPNEIAQAEGATGKSPFVKYWIHGAFLKVEGRKMSKSLGNLYTVQDAEKKGFDPLALRYLYLTARHRDTLNFTWKSLESAQNALTKLKNHVSDFKKQTSRSILSQDKRDKVDLYMSTFVSAINNDLDTPKALAVVWATVKSNIPAMDKHDLLLSFDEVLGLGLTKIKTFSTSIPKEILKLVDKREKLRVENKFNEADTIRLKILKKGYVVKDTLEGPKVRPSLNRVN